MGDVDDRRDGAEGRDLPAGEIPVGLLFSLSGGLAETERSMQRGALLAIEQVNASGGIAGRPLTSLVEDYASDTMLAAARARALLGERGVRVCVGGYTSASRVAMLPAFHDGGGLLVYPTYYEGLEQDSHALYAGAVPNQFLPGYVDWVVEHLGGRIYMVGSDYVYPRTLGVMIRQLARAAGATVLEDRYVPLGCVEFATVLDEIERLRPDVVISNVVGSDSVPAFYRQFRAAGHTAATLPIAATVTTEVELAVMGPELGAGHYMVGTYFGTLDNAANRGYVAALRRRFGPTPTHVAQVGAYNAVWLLALAATRAGSLSLTALSDAMAGLSFEDNPEGWPLTVHANRHAEHPAYIARARPDGEYEIIAAFEPRPPEPYPLVLVPQGHRPSPIGTG